MYTYTTNDLIHESLVKLGASLYLHAKIAEDAKKAEEAVAYLKEQGVFSE